MPTIYIPQPRYIYTYIGHVPEPLLVVLRSLSSIVSLFAFLLVKMLSIASLVSLASLAAARDIVFPPVSGYQSPLGNPIQVDGLNDMDLSSPLYAGLTTFANLPYVHCLAKDPAEVERFDIAILGAPFDTAVSARPGARFGPDGIRAGSRRIHPQFAYSVYTGQNSFMEWAKIVDCGSAPMTFFDNTVALKQLEKAHRIIGGRATNASEYPIPRIVTLGGDHTTTLPALRAAYEHWGAVSVIHFDSHLGELLASMM